VESGIARFLEVLNDDDAFPADLMKLSVRQG
jgi:hypothetical protein